MAADHRCMSDTQQLVIFSLHGEQYALPITTVQEIIRHTEPRSLASSTPWLKGVINLRGKIIPVCDLAGRLGLPGHGAETPKTVVAETPAGTVGVIEMMRDALERAEMRPDEIDYVNAHGTSTPYNDAAETQAIKQVFGGHAYKMAISSNKSMIGHLFGAAGAVEALATALTIHHGVIPPTINLHHPDPECDLDYVPNVARTADVRTGLSNSMGLGGHNACLILRRVE